MCGRFYIDIEDKGIQSIIDAVNRKMAGVPEAPVVKTGEIFWADAVPIYISEAGRAALTVMRWGFRGTAGGRVIINARGETMRQKLMFREAAGSRRCLVPASGYFEWEKRGKERVKYRIQTDDTVLYMAALYRMEENARLPAFTIITREAAPDIRFIHDRMPVILGREALGAWMGGADAREAQDGAALDVRFEACLM